MGPRSLCNHIDWHRDKKGWLGPSHEKFGPVSGMVEQTIFLKNNHHNAEPVGVAPFYRWGCDLYTVYQ